MLIPKSHHDLLEDRIRALAFLATTMADGTPQVTPVWFDTDGDLLRVNTAEGRTKCRNMKARPAVALAILDPSNPYRYVQVRGSISRWTHEGARSHIDRLAKKYQGVATYDGPQDEQRVTFIIEPNSVTTQG